MRHRAVLAALLPMILAGAAAVAPAQQVAADSPTVSVDQTRTGWDPNEPLLTPSAIAGGGFGQLWSSAIDGVVFARPVTAHGVVIVVTEHDMVYGIDETTGSIRWATRAGTYDGSQGCDQVTPDVGITSTPVIDPAANVVYVMARDKTGANSARWLLHRYDLFGGGETGPFPVEIAGTASNAGTLAFDPTQHEQRPGLLLLGGTVVAGFGSFCDHEPYQGWISTVSAGSGAQSLYTDVPQSQTEGAFWAGGSGFVADSPNSFLVTSANPPTGSGAGQAPLGYAAVNGGTDLSDAVIRLQLGGDGLTLTPTDYFSPRAGDTSDADLGSSGFAALPAQFGARNGHTNLGVVGGKFGTLYVLDRDHLGGRQTSDGGAVSKLTGTDSLFGHIASWPGDGGFVYDSGTGHLNSFTLNAAGALVLSTRVGISYGSSSPLVTSSGMTGGSATVWIYERNSHELRAYTAVGLSEIFHATVGSTGDTHFNEVAADSNRVFVAADDGHVHAFGVGGLPPVPCNCGTAGGHDPNAGQGYWEVAADGGIFPWGNAFGYGSTGGIHLNQPIVGMASTPGGHGYWLVASDGGIFPFGDAVGYGSTGAIHLNRPVVGMAATPTGHGYWLVASDGGIFPFGDAVGYGSTGGIHLNQPVVGMAATASGGGYWLVASDGGIFPFGDAFGYGSTGGIHLNQPIVGMARTHSGAGYWLVAADGGIFPFGDAGQHSYGSEGGTHLNQPVVGMTPTPSGNGYWLVASDGGIFTHGDAVGYGSTGATQLNQPMVGIASTA